MPELNIWNLDDMAERAKPKRQRKREERERMVQTYREYFKNVKPGFGGEVLLSEEEDKRKIRMLIREAAEQQGINLRFRPIKDAQRIEFRVLPKEDKTSSTGAKRGRPRKTKTEE